MYKFCFKTFSLIERIKPIRYVKATQPKSRATVTPFEPLIESKCVSIRVWNLICLQTRASKGISVREICLSDIIVMFDKSQELSFVIAEVCLRIEALG